MKSLIFVFPVVLAFGDLAKTWDGPYVSMGSVRNIRPY